MDKNSIFQIFLLIFCEVASVRNDCPAFNKHYEDAKAITLLEDDINAIRESRTTSLNSDSKLSPEMEADVFTVAAMFSARGGGDLSSFSANSVCLSRFETPQTSHQKYRTFDGYGNNLKHPFWGASNTPYNRFGPKNYVDSIYTIRRSQNFLEKLPNPRKIVDNVLNVSPKAVRDSNIPNYIFLSILAALSIDIGLTKTRQTSDLKSIQCCSAGNKGFLPRAIRHPSCLPIAVSKNDPFYKNFQVRCLNQVRSEVISTPSAVNFGEIKNTMTSFADLSTLYGENEMKSKEIRSFSRGQIFLSPGKSFPVNAQGQTIAKVLRFSIAVNTFFCITFFSRQHNWIAESLGNLNPTWNDEKIFQEARRINIAISQNFVTSKEFTEIIVGQQTYGDKNYNENINPSTFVEYMQAASRIGHFFNQPTMSFTAANGVSREIPLSDTIGNLSIPELFFDDSVRGALNTKINLKSYTDELHNKAFKNKEGFGIDLFAFDIQRGRDHGIPTWLEVRKACKLKADFTNFESLSKILPLETTKLLEKAYESVEDIDLLVGGALESFGVLNRQLLGPSLSCIFREQYRRFISGDSYFFTHKNSPNPFSASQLNSIKSFTVNHMICVNSNIKFTLKNPLFVESSSNPKVPCSDFKLMNLKPWIGV